MALNHRRGRLSELFDQISSFLNQYFQSAPLPFPRQKTMEGLCNRLSLADAEKLSACLCIFSTYGHNRGQEVGRRPRSDAPPQIFEVFGSQITSFCCRIQKELAEITLDPPPNCR